MRPVSDFRAIWRTVSLAADSLRRCGRNRRMRANAKAGPNESTNGRVCVHCHMPGDAWTINSDKNVQTLSFLAALANTHRVTQVNPGKTNRTDGAFQLFKDGKVGMVMGFSPLAAQLDAEGKVHYGVTQMPTNVGTPVTLGVEDYLMAFKKKGNQEAVRQFLDLYYQPEQITRWITAEGFLPVTKTGLARMSGNEKLKPYLDALPSARLAPTTDPVWDKVKLDVQQTIGLAVQPGGDPRQVLGPAR